MTAKPSKKYPYSELVLDPRCQAREDISLEAVEDYRAAYEAKVALPPIDVFIVDGKPHVVDGWHRMAGAAKAGEAWMRTVIVGTGTVEQAAWHALGANQANGLRRTNADKRRAVLMALESPIGNDQSSRVLSEHIGVSHDFVSRLRAEWEAEHRPKMTDEVATQATGQVSSDDTSRPRRTGKDGKSYPVPARAPKERVVLDEPAPEPDDIAHEYPVEDDAPLPHEPETTDLPQGDNLVVPAYGPALTNIARAVARVRIDIRSAGVPTSIAQTIERGLKDVESIATFAVPEVCPRCSGAKCIHCRQNGWVTREDAATLRVKSAKAAG